MSKRLKHFYEFGDFRLDPVERQLRRAGRFLPLTPKAFEVLLLLVENGGHAIKKGEFLEKVWAGSYVEEKNLADNISLLRKALGDDPRSPTFIETVPRLGYRFMAEVKEVEKEALIAERTRMHMVVEEQEEPQDGGAGVTQVALPRAARAMRMGRMFRLLAGSLALLGCAALGVYLIRGSGGEAKPVQPIKSLAVLPFKPLDTASRDQALELGMADSLITRLSSIRELVVRPTSSVRTFTDLEADPFEIGQKLEVESVLEGHIQRAGDRVRVTLRLVRVAGGEALWASQFDEKFTDIFALQDSISERVAAALVPRLSSDEAGLLKKRYTEDTDAYRLYTLGRYFWNKRTPEGFAKALDFYRQAAAADPNYALAHAGLAETYALLPNWTDALPEESYPEAERAARRALELDPRLADAYNVLASVRENFYRDWAGAGDHYRRALELNPNNATTRQWYGEWLGAMGRYDEAVAQAKTAQRLDPLSPIITFTYGVALYNAGRLDEAEPQLRRALELDAGIQRPRIFLARLYFDRGRYEESIMERALLIANGDGGKAAVFEAKFRAAFRTGGRDGFLRKMVEMRSDPRLSQDHKIGGWVEGCALLGDADCAIEALREAERVRHPISDGIGHDPYFDFLRGDPRYTEMSRRLKPRP